MEKGTRVRIKVGALVKQGLELFEWEEGDRDRQFVITALSDVPLGLILDETFFARKVDVIEVAEPVETEEHKFRRLLWLNHGCALLYGDDGKMQCGACGIDFLRATADEIAEGFAQRAKEKEK